METPPHITVAFLSQNVLLSALVATHPEPARLQRAFERLAADCDARNAEDPLISGALTAALDAIRAALQAKPIP